MEIEKILNEIKSVEMDMEDYKLKIIKGELPLSQMAQNKILKSSETVAEYGKYLAKVNGINIDTTDFSNNLVLGGLYAPSDDIQKKYSENNDGKRQVKMNTLSRSVFGGVEGNESGSRLTWAEIKRLCIPGIRG